MKLFLARHADAVEFSEYSDLNDDQRYLSGAGRITERKVAEKVKEHISDLDMIFTSPLIRAVQTAEIIAAVSGYSSDIIPVQELRNESRTSSLTDLLNRSDIYSSVMLVGHEPKMSMLVNLLSGALMKESFSKSGICLMESLQDSGQYIFKWYFGPNKMAYIR
ncbi:MAG: histidine phosphatase family protein [Bacteroidetes bacterium]|nr:histidine phosphatase family protein [Bacteroidota bacterium]